MQIVSVVCEECGIVLKEPVHDGETRYAAEERAYRLHEEQRHKKEKV